MSATAQHYSEVLEDSETDPESLTVLVVTGMDRAAVAGELGIDLDRPIDPDGVYPEDANLSAYAVAEIAGGVLAVEWTGYADPSNATLRRLSAGGGRAAVARSNIQGHHRFGCAADGELVFDDDEYIFIEDRDRVPAELRPLFDAARVDLDGDLGAETADPVATGLAMTEVFTGVPVTASALSGVAADGVFVVRCFAYVEKSDD